MQTAAPTGTHLYTPCDSIACGWQKKVSQRRLIHSSSPALVSRPHELPGVTRCSRLARRHHASSPPATARSGAAAGRGGRDSTGCRCPLGGAAYMGAAPPAWGGSAAAASAPSSPSSRSSPRLRQAGDPLQGESTGPASAMTARACGGHAAPGSTRWLPRIVMLAPLLTRVEVSW
eukprot:scaffold35832_cov53-Phaeocystis_antarctica.AAC.2